MESCQITTVIQHTEGCEIGGRIPEHFGMKIGNKNDSILKSGIILILLRAKNILPLYTIQVQYTYSNALYLQLKAETEQTSSPMAMPG